MAARENAKPQAVCGLSIRASRRAHCGVRSRQGKDGIVLPANAKKGRGATSQHTVQIPVLQEARHVGGEVVVDGPVEERA